MPELFTADFDEWNKTPENKRDLQTSGESIHWNELDRTEPCEIYQRYDNAPVHDFRYTFEFRIDKIWNQSQAKRLIIRLLWLGNDSQNFISIYPEQRVGSNSRYGLVFHQQVNGGNSPDHYHDGATFAVGEQYRAVVYRDGSTCGFMIFSMDNSEPIVSYENIQWNPIPYNQVSFARLDQYTEDLIDWSSGRARG